MGDFPSHLKYPKSHYASEQPHLVLGLYLLKPLSNAVLENFSLLIHSLTLSLFFFLIIVSLCSLDWIQSCNPPASASPVLPLQMLVSLNICVWGGTDRQTLVGEKEAELVPVPMYMYLMHVWVLVEAKKGC